MTRALSRRAFLLQTAAAGAVAMLGSRSATAFPFPRPDPPLQLAVVTGGLPFDAARKAIDMLGGITKFVSRGSRVGLLINSRYTKPGTFVNPEIALALIALCGEAGAGSMRSLENVSEQYWRRTKHHEEYREAISQITDAGAMRTVSVKGGRVLREAEICTGFLECDVLINLSIVKHHEGIGTTGALKNIMGATSGATNQYFHFGSHARGYYDDVDFLSQCIADANLLRKPDLSVMDATAYIVTNGPFGPGRIVAPGIVLAGTDPVAVDSFGAAQLGLEPSGVHMIRKAHEHGIGEFDLSKVVCGRARL